MAENQLNSIINDLIRTKENVEFFVGRNCDSDTIVALAIKRHQKRFAKEDNSSVLILPYTIANMEYLEDFYDEIWIPVELHGEHFKSAITKRNKWFVNNSDVIIAYVLRNKGGV